MGAPFLPRPRPVPSRRCGERRPRGRCHGSWGRCVQSRQPRRERRREGGRAAPPRAAAAAAAAVRGGARSRMRRGWLCGPAGPRRCAPESSVQVAPGRRGGCPALGGVWAPQRRWEARSEAWLTKRHANKAGLFLLQDFKVGNLLGKGSFAGVYRAVSLKTGLEVAIKMVRQPAEEVPVSLETKCKVAAGWGCAVGH